MKLIEIFQVSKTNEPLPRYKERLETMAQQGIKTIGTGSYAQVFQHPAYDEMVVKVSEEGENIIKYLEFAYHNQDNPFVPKIHDLRRFIGPKGKRYFVAFLEKLQPYEPLPQEQKQKLIQTNLGLSSDHVEVEQALEFFYAADFGHLAKLVSEGNSPHKNHLVKLFLFLKTIPWKDVWDDNIMLRGNKQLVFIDPVT